MTLSRPQTLEEELTRLRLRVAELERNFSEQSHHGASEENRELYQAFLANMPLYAWVKDDGGRYVYVNCKLQEFLQNRGVNWFGKTDSDLWPLQIALRMRTTDLAAIASGAPYQTVETIPDPDGELTWQTSRFRIAAKSGRFFLCGIAEDLTGKSRLNSQGRATSGEGVLRAQSLAMFDALRRSETRVNRMFHSELTGIVEVEGSTIVDANEALLGWLGLTRSELQDTPIDWRDLTAPRFRNLDDQCLEQLQTTGVCRAYEKELVCRDGRVIPVMACASMLDLARGCFIGFFLNLSDRKEVGARLLRSQKLESLGVIAGGVAHDFNNLLATIMGNASLAADALVPDHAAYRHLSEVLVGSKRASDLTEQMLAYSGRANFKIRSIDISSLVREIGSLLETTISKKLNLVFRLSDELPSLEGDEGQIHQVIMNLVINASDAVGENPGEITVSTYAGEGAHADCVCFEVRDTGCGMDDATKTRIFDPFFTTKTEGRGLGLAAVMNIMRNHSGSLAVESAPGRGTTFRAFFPASKAPKPVRPENRFSKLGGTETILIVDDDEGIRRMTKTSLERLGYAVLVATDGAHGVEVYRQHQAAVSLVLLDWAMPAMNGEEALERIHEINPEAKVLLSSGYAETETVKRVGSGSLAGFLQKPYTTTRLAAQIREILAVPASQRL